MEWSILSALLGSFSLNVASQILLSRAGRSLLGQSLLGSVFSGCALGFLVLLGLHVWLGGGVETFLTNAVTYVALSYGYFHFINLGETARRVRILRELKEADRPLSLADLLQRYNTGTILALRLERLLGKGQIRREGDRYFIGQPAVLWMARGILFLRGFLLPASRPPL